MKVFGRWLVMQQRTSDGKRVVVSSGNTKKSCQELLDLHMTPAGPNLWTNENSIFWVEKNTTEYPS